MIIGRDSLCNVNIFKQDIKIKYKQYMLINLKIYASKYLLYFNLTLFFNFHFTSCSLSPSQSFRHFPSPSSLSRWGPPGYPPTMAHQNSVRLGVSSPTEARQGRPARRTYSVMIADRSMFSSERLHPEADSDRHRHPQPNTGWSLGTLMEE